MSLKDIQKDVDNWAQQFKNPYFKPLEIMTRLAEEVGELARELNHRYGPKKKKSEEEVQEIGSEIADIFMTLICLANSHNIDLDESWRKLIDKLYDRDSARYEKKAGESKLS